MPQAYPLLGGLLDVLGSCKHTLLMGAQDQAGFIASFKKNKIKNWGGEGGEIKKNVFLVFLLPLSMRQELRPRAGCLQQSPTVAHPLLNTPLGRRDQEPQHQS